MGKERGLAECVHGRWIAILAPISPLKRRIREMKGQAPTER